MVGAVIELVVVALIELVVVVARCVCCSRRRRWVLQPFTLESSKSLNSDVKDRIVDSFDSIPYSRVRIKNANQPPRNEGSNLRSEVPRAQKA